MVRALVTPGMVQWARERAGVGIGEAAHMMNVNQELIEAWESGDAAPSMTKAEELARRYRVPLAALYMEHPLWKSHCPPIIVRYLVQRRG